MCRFIRRVIGSLIMKPFMKPSRRYSSRFAHIVNLLQYSPREQMLKTAMEFVSISEVNGDYLEFGSYGGHSFTIAFHFGKHRKMNFYAFDSFEGLPEITGIDAEGYKPFEKGEYACGLQKFKESISKKGVDLERVRIIPGWYKDTLNEESKEKLGIKSAAVVWIDCDLYDSATQALNFVTDYLVDGTILIFDDWFCFKGDPNRGEQRAFDEWLKRNPTIKAIEFHKFGWHGNSFIINRL